MEGIFLLFIATKKHSLINKLESALWKHIFTLTGYISPVHKASMQEFLRINEFLNNAVFTRIETTFLHPTMFVFHHISSKKLSKNFPNIVLSSSMIWNTHQRFSSLYYIIPYYRKFIYTFFSFISICICIPVESCSNIPMSHCTLNSFDICFIFTISCAECMSKMMTRKPW